MTKEQVRIVDEDWGTMLSLPCQLTLELRVPAFTVRSLLRLEKDTVIDTKWSQGTDIPLRANGQLIGWTEFEVVGERLALRLTELA
ncbi:MAG TPA: FliM/FliN family flagellar motor C-terminal domain-containing protein [Clostridia bacterium]|nr:FliM/FliN family flagellar motor C-terminal domain-containing protein [Clostridia bacterium]